MAKSVLICGLCISDYEGISGVADLPFACEVWTCNDWYTFLPWLQPNQVWNIHNAGQHINQDPWRFQNDWQGWYNRAIDRGCKVIVRAEIHGVNPAGQEFIDMDRFTAQTPKDTWACTISMQIAEAVLQGFDVIKIIGARFDENEYDYQPYSCLQAVKFAEAQGCYVEILPDGRREHWAVESMASTTGAITPYWMR